MTYPLRIPASLALAIGLGTLIAAAVATAVSAHDWHVNPEDLFHTAAGTNWPVVWETWISWFEPVFLAITAPGLLATYARAVWGWIRPETGAWADPSGIAPAPVPPAPSPAAPPRPAAPQARGEGAPTDPEAPLNRDPSS